MRAAAAIAALAFASCGTETAQSGAAAPQTIEIGTTDLDGHNGVGFVLEVRRLEITSSGWSVEARVANATPVRWAIGRPHVRDGTKFGLFVAPRASDLTPAAVEASGRTTPGLIAESFDPPLPRVLGPGAQWAGSFSGRGHIPKNSFVKFAFGRFTTYAAPPAGLPPKLMAVTSRPVRVG